VYERFVQDAMVSCVILSAVCSAVSMRSAWTAAASKLVKSLHERAAALDDRRGVHEQVENALRAASIG